MFVLPSRIASRLSPLLVVVIVLGSYGMRFSARAEDSEVTECDKFAASDLDFQRNSRPIALKDIDSNLAIPACMKAVSEQPENQRLTYQLGRSLLAGKQWLQGLRNIRLAAEAGYAAAELALGGFYETASFGMVEDQKEAELWFQKAAEQQNPKAQFRLGRRLAESNDRTRAFAWYCRSAEQGDADAQHSLGLAYLRGDAWIGAPSDPVRGYEWLAKSAAQGSQMAQQDLTRLQQIRGRQNAWARGPDKCKEVIRCVESGRTCR